MSITEIIGKNIKTFRKKKGLTIQALANQLHKSKATVSKYERGEITLDVLTLHELANLLSVDIEQLLYNKAETIPANKKRHQPAFFAESNQFYSYLYDGRSNELIRCVFDVVASADGQSSTVYMYMNFKDYAHYQNSENTYKGTIEHYDALTNIVMRNQDTHMEQVTVSILASFLDSNTKWGLFFGISSRPMMPIAVKMLFSKQPLEETDELLQKLKVSKEDIRLLKLYNMFSAT